MGRTKWGAIVLMVALAACAKDEADDGAMTDDMAGAPAESPGMEPAPGMENLPAGVTQDMVTAGQQIFSSNGNCFTCHGADGKGTQLAPNLTDSDWINADGTYQSIVSVIHSGVPTPKQFPAPMPAMGGAPLNDEQVNQVAAYVWALGGGK